MENNTSVENATPVKLKSAIIGKMWTNVNAQEMVPASYTLPKDITLSANESYLIGNLSIRTDRNLNASETPGEVKPVFLKAGDKLFFFTNNKRTERDPDYSISIQLPENLANVIIKNSQDAAKAWKEAHPNPEDTPTQTE